MVDDKQGRPTEFDKAKAEVKKELSKLVRSFDEAVKHEEDLQREKEERARDRKANESKEEIKDTRTGFFKSFMYIMGLLIVLIYISLSLLERDYLQAILFSVVAFVLAFFFMLSKRKIKEWDKYDSLINFRGNTSLEKIACIMNKPLLEVCNDIQVMINEEFFRLKGEGLSAYIDHEYSLLVMTYDGEPLVNPAESVKKEQDKFEQAQVQSKELDNSFVLAIRDFIEQVDDDEMKNILFDMEGYVRRINAQVDRRPELQNNRDIVKLSIYYLPEIIKLIEKYLYSNSEEMKNKIEDTLQECTIALKKIESEIVKEDQDNTDVDIMVLMNTLKREGLLDPEFNVSRK